MVTKIAVTTADKHISYLDKVFCGAVDNCVGKLSTICARLVGRCGRQPLMLAEDAVARACHPDSCVSAHATVPAREKRPSAARSREKGFLFVLFAPFKVRESTMSVEALSGKAFVVITGASRGIGAEIALQFSRLLAEGSRVLLLARDVGRLKETAGKMPKHLRIDCESVDLAVAGKDVLEGILKKSLGSEGTKNVERAVIVHNAGSVGNVAKTTIDMDDYDEWRKYFDLNVFAPAILNGVFMKIFTDQTKVARLVINVTSLCAIEPMKSTGFYNTGKAARELYFKTFAVEFPQVNVLNWSPGPVDTDMFNAIARDSGDAEIRAKFEELRENKDVLTTEQSTNRLILVLKDQKYKSGDHIDYYDQL